MIEYSTKAVRSFYNVLTDLKRVNWPTKIWSKIWLNIALKSWDRFTMYWLTWEELTDQLKYDWI